MPRPAYDAVGCACSLTCSTQPVTVVVRQWRCALFLHPVSGRLWFVMSTDDGKWDWESANEIDDRADAYETSRTIEMSLHRIVAAVAEG